MAGGAGSERTGLRVEVVDCIGAYGNYDGVGMEGCE